jgi:hypothetical protein
MVISLHASQYQCIYTLLLLYYKKLLLYKLIYFKFIYLQYVYNLNVYIESFRTRVMRLMVLYK